MTEARPLPPGITEKAFQQIVIDYAILQGFHVAHFRPAQIGSRWITAMQGHTGYVDLTLARKGKVIFAELKAQDGRVSPEQRAWARELGPRYRLWKPSDWPAILTELRRPA